MARLSIEQLRRRELAGAAYEILQEEGIAGTTLAKVAARAGMSKGIVLHYFKGEDELLEMVTRHANALLRDEVADLMTRAGTRRERIVAIIAGNFSPNWNFISVAPVVTQWRLGAARRDVVPINLPNRRIARPEG